MPAAAKRLSWIAIGMAAVLGCSPEQSDDPPGGAVAEPAATVDTTVLAEIPGGAYVVDKTHAYITLTYSHLGFSRPHVGFSDFDVELNLVPDDPSASQLAVTVYTGSVYSRVEKFDTHLKAEELFDTDNFPTATFTATAIEVKGAELNIVGDLTIKDTTQSVTLTGKINKAGQHPILNKPTIGVSASANLKRSDWGLSLAVPNVGDDVIIYIEAELPKAD